MKVKVGMWFKSGRIAHSSPYPFTVNLRIDGSSVPITVDAASIPVTDYHPSTATWKQLVATNTYFGGSTAASHKITLFVSSTVPGSQDIFLADDFFVTPVSVNGLPVCST
ncbi:MAG: hypothetical protein EOO38_19990 [Cytophagaceae bacterium]|nr:MAG: hypothetical protein EOO38_19990 [Cytophagaceae bacterium]